MLKQIVEIRLGHQKLTSARLWDAKIGEQGACDGAGVPTSLRTGYADDMVEGSMLLTIWLSLSPLLIDRKALSCAGCKAATFIY
jgi:hypothetical protein